MRIRKRKVPLPISLLSPVPLSDPHLFSRSSVIMVQNGHHHHGTNDNSSSHSQPSDHLTSDLHRVIEDGNSSTGAKGDPTITKQELGSLGFGGPEGGAKINNDASKGSMTAMGAAVDNNGPIPFSNDEEVARWCEGDKVIPLKKRRGSFEQTSANDVRAENEKTTMSSEIVTNKDEKEVKHHDREHDQKQKKVNITHGDICISDNNPKSNNVASAKKGNKRGNTIMEGSRCSRVNGRGWRCCQPTLVGYSLCEHHLGKGRLRSMTSVRGRPSLSKKAVGTTGVLSSIIAPSPSMLLGETAQVPKDTETTERKKKTVTTMNSSTGKRTKLGVVKARSLSSLLGQTSTAISSNSFNIAVAAMVELKKGNNLDQ